MFKKINEIIQPLTTRTAAALVNDNGDLIHTTQDKNNQWELYIERLFADKRSDIIDIAVPEEYLEILKSEVRKASKINKAVGPDAVYAEVIKIMSNC